MRFRNKHNINLYKNPMKRSPQLLDTKNRLESKWYDDEARELWDQLKHLPKLMPIDQDFEKWFAPFYDNSDRSNLFDRDYIYFSAFGNVAGMKVLELGAGNGCLSRYMIRRGAEVCSIDLSSEYCRILARSEKSSMPVLACAEILPFKSESFDVVTTFVALHHFNLDLGLPEIKRILKKGGRGIFMEPLLDSKSLYYLRQLVPVRDNESPGGGGLKTAEIRTAFDRLDLSYEIQVFELFTRLERLKIISGLQRILRRTDHLLFRVVPYLRRFARTAVILIGKS
jgi:ubiquinone/menaquinone biosynthesis C-methylase UbiE